MLIRLILHISLLLFAFHSGFGQVRFYTTVSHNAPAVGESFQLQFIVEGKVTVQQINPPDLSQFRVLSIFENNSSSVQSAGLQLTQTYALVYVLLPLKKGKQTIPAATALINGQKQKSNPVTIRVTARKSGSALPYNTLEEVPVEAVSRLYPGDDPARRVSKNLFLRAYANKNSCYAGECLQITYKMYSRLDNAAQVQKRPALTGLSIIEMADSYDVQPELETYDGIPYYTSLIRKVQAFPLQAGAIQLDPAEVSSVVHFVKLNEGDGAGAYRTMDYPTLLKSNALEIKVNPLPTADQPLNFSGAVGKFDLQIQAPDRKLHPGELVKIQVLVTGTGNIPLLVPPTILWPKGVDTAEPVVREDFNKYVFPLKGSKLFEYSFAAPDTGIYEIPATSYPFFNPATGKYETAMSSAVRLEVVPGEAKAETVAALSQLQLSEERVPRQLYWFGVVVLVILSWVAYQIFKPGAPKNKAPLPVVVPEAGNAIQDQLDSAAVALEAANTPLFYRELERACWSAIAAMGKTTPSLVNKKNLRRILLAAAVDEDRIQELTAVLAECEWARYVPQHETNDARQLLQKARVVLESLKV